MPMPGPLELVVILVIALVIFGPKRLPELGGSLGKGIREFRTSVTGKDNDRAELNEAQSTSTETVDGEIVQEKRA
jgi:sec-independent protein translocase protein TatA